MVATVDQMSADRAALMTGSVPLKADTVLRDTSIYCRPHQTAFAQRDAHPLEYRPEDRALLLAEPGLAS